ncbi:MAG: hypothetical protein WEF50_11295 [Myxococcota bacterium]
MAKKKAAKKTTGKRVPAKTKKTAAPMPRRASAQKAGTAELDPVTAALQRRRLAMLSR